MTAQTNGPFERIDPPQYVAFRKASGGSMLTVIAKLEARDIVGHHLGRWFSELTPNGHFRDVPVDIDRYGIDESVAQDLIDLIFVRPTRWAGAVLEHHVERLVAGNLVVGGTAGVVRAASAVVRLSLIHI